MHAISSIAVVAFAALALAYPEGRLRSRSDQLVDCLTTTLSSEGVVLTPDNPEFVNATIRYSSLYIPTFRVVAQVDNEDDLRASIQCATQSSSTFFVTGPRHGSSSAQVDLHDLFQISTAGFDKITVDPEANTMDVGGSVRFGQVINSLDAVQKAITVGSGLTVGIVGASIGAGVGRLEGLYGLIVDSLLSVRIMLPDTTVVQASETENPELFWGIRGAGFNFGYILNATYQVYDQSFPNGMQLNADLLFPVNYTKSFWEALSGQVPLPAPLSVISATSLNLETHELNLLVNAVYSGPEDEGRKAIQFLLDLGSTIAQNISYVSWPDLIPTSLFGIGASNATSSLRRSDCSVAFNEIDPDALVKATEQLQTLVDTYPQCNTSSISLYMPATQATLAKPLNSTSYPWREIVGHYVVEINYNDNTTDADIGNYYADMRATLAATAGTETPQTYLGFAHGDESFERLFSAEHMPRLAALKKQYDPSGLFNAYHSLPTQYP